MATAEVTTKMRMEHMRLQPKDTLVLSRPGRTRYGQVQGKRGQD